MRGRKPRAELASSNMVRIRLSPQELRRAAEAAHVNRQTISDFVRDAIVEAAEDCLDPLPKEEVQP